MASARAMSLIEVLLIAIGGSLALEGAAWAIFPSQMRRIYQEAFASGDRVLHLTGLVSVAIGVLMIAWAVKSVGS